MQTHTHLCKHTDVLVFKELKNKGKAALLTLGRSVHIVSPAYSTLRKRVLQVECMFTFPFQSAKTERGVLMLPAEATSAAVLQKLLKWLQVPGKRGRTARSSELVQSRCCHQTGAVGSWDVCYILLCSAQLIRLNAAAPSAIIWLVQQRKQRLF